MFKCKKLIGIILIILLIVSSFTVVANADANQIIVCEDENLYNALCEKISGATGNDVTKTITISTDTLNGLTELNLSGKNITNLKGIESLTALTTLNLSNNNISDLSKLSGLTNLAELNISNNNVTDLSVLSNNQLTLLRADNNKITTLDGLGTMETLTYLYVNNNLLTSLSGVDSNANVTEIYASNNKITDISNVLSNAGLKILNVSNNKIAKVSYEGQDSALTQLNLSGNQLEDVSFLKDLSALNNLDLSNNKIRTIPEFLANWINNSSIGVLKLNNQKVSVVSQEKTMAFDKNSGYTNLLYWAYYFSAQDLATEVENGELDKSNLVFSFTDENKDSSITISDGVLSGSKIVVSYGGSKTETTAESEDDKNTATDNTTTENKESNKAENAKNDANSNTVDKEENVESATENSDETTATGKMPYTGITSKVVGIASLVTILGAIVVYTYSQNKKNMKK